MSARSTGLRRGVAAAAVLAALVGLGTTTSQARPGPTAPAASATTDARGAAAAPSATTTSTAAATAVPSTCGALFHRVNDGRLYWATLRGQRMRAGAYGDAFTGLAPKAMTFVRVYEEGDRLVEQYLAVMENGALWNVRNEFGPGGWTGTYPEQIAASGWSAVRELVVSDSGYVYGLTTTGGLYRYTLSTSGVVRGAGAVATSGWSGVKTLSYAAGGTFRGAEVDGLLGISTTGALVEYVVRLQDRVARGFVLRSSGWGGMAFATSGGCETGLGRPIVGVTPGGQAYAFYDRNGYDLSGADIRGTGQVGRGFSGLLFD